jgi:hypothetical protein
VEGIAVIDIPHDDLSIGSRGLYGGYVIRSLN